MAQAEADAPASVLDASALLAHLNDEEGAPFVREAMKAGAAISVANWAEVLSAPKIAGFNRTQPEWTWLYRPFSQRAAVKRYGDPHGCGSTSTQRPDYPRSPFSAVPVLRPYPRHPS